MIFHVLIRLVVKGLFHFDFRLWVFHVVIFYPSEQQTFFMKIFNLLFASISQTVHNALPDLPKVTDEYPCIVACGKKEDKIDRYIISIDNQPMYVPKEYSFEQTIDLFFKMHYVLSLEFDPRLENVFSFMEHYIYEMEGGAKQPYTTMIELSNAII